jgi:Uncharacterized conserved protein (DUF2299)
MDPSTVAAWLVMFGGATAPANDPNASWSLDVFMRPLNLNMAVYAPAEHPDVTTVESSVLYGANTNAAFDKLSFKNKAAFYKGLQEHLHRPGIHYDILVKQGQTWGPGTCPTAFVVRASVRNAELTPQKLKSALDLVANTTKAADKYGSDYLQSAPR